MSLMILDICVVWRLIENPEWTDAERGSRQRVGAEFLGSGILSGGVTRHFIT